MTGRELARAFWEEAVAPIVARAAPGARVTAGLLGDCSDVIGFDDAVSRDHGWGPRGTLLVEDQALARRLHATLAEELPPRFRGLPTAYDGVLPAAAPAPPLRHWVDVHTVESLLRAELGVARATGLAAREWVALREDKLLGVTAGALFHDDLGFAAVQRALGFYPEDLRLYLMAASWMRIADEQAFPARAGSVGDEVGSAIVAARLAERLMRLAFLAERRYAPYAKWFGSAFARLPRCAAIGAALARMVAAPSWVARDAAWGEALAATIRLYEEEGLLPAGRYRTAAVYVGRPGTGLPQLERGGPPPITELIDALRARIVEPEARALADALQPE